MRTRMSTTRLSRSRRHLSAAAAFVVIGAPALEGQRTEEFELPGREVAVYNLAGEVRIVQGRGSNVVVRVTLLGPDAQTLDVEVGQVGGSQALRVIYPEDRIIYPELGRGSRTTVSVRSDGTFYGGGRSRGDRVEVRGSGRGLEAHANLEIEVPAGTEFSLYLAVGQTDIRGVSGDFIIDTGAGEVVAQDIQGSLRVDTGSGHVSVRGVEGDVLVDTGSGSVEVEDIRGGEINVDTGSGRVTGRRLSATSVRVDTGSGRIELDEVTSEDVSLDTGSGSIRVEILSDVENLDIDTGSGSVTVWLPEIAGAELEIETGNGGIELDFPVQIRRAGRDHVIGTIGDGRGRIHIDTGSGSIRLARR